MKRILFASLVFVSACVLTAQQSSGAYDNNGVNVNPSPNPPPSNQQGATYTRTFAIEPAHVGTTNRPSVNQPAPEKVEIVVVPGYNPMRTPTSSTFNIVTVHKPNASPAAAYGAPQTYTQPNPAQPQQAYGYGQPQTPPSSNNSNRFNLAPENSVPTANTSPAAANSAPQTCTQPNPAQPQAYGYGQPQTPPSSNNSNRFNLVPENTVPNTNAPPAATVPQTAQPQQGYGYGQPQTPPSSNNSNRFNLVPENTADINGPRGTGIVSKTEEVKIKIYQVESYPVWREPSAR